MKPNYWRTIVGVFLLLAGVAALLQVLGFIPAHSNLMAVLFALLFILGGVVFLSVLVRDNQKWWAAIPGIILVDLGLLIAFSELMPVFSDKLGGGFFLAGVGLSFWVVYFVAPRNWWAIIPGGVMFSLAIVAVAENWFGFQNGAILFLGFALTFGLLGVLPSQNGQKMTWPWYPASACLLVALIISFATMGMGNTILPVALIFGGLFLLFRAFYGKERK